VWAVDFQFDSTTDGRHIKIVSIIDEHTRECLSGLLDCRFLHPLWCPFVCIPWRYPNVDTTYGRTGQKAPP
jgi:hypothetical protein